MNTFVVAILALLSVATIPAGTEASSSTCPLIDIEVVLKLIGDKCSGDTTCNTCMPKICDTCCQQKCDSGLLSIIVTLALNLKLLVGITAVVSALLNGNIQLKVLLYLLLLLGLKAKLGAILNVALGVTLQICANLLGLVDLSAGVGAEVKALL